MFVTLLRILGAAITSLLGLVLVLVVLIAVYGWNWVRPPLERYTLEKTGRVLQLHGDVTVRLAWPLVRLRANGVQFANPAWAKEPQMLQAQGVEIAVDLTQLLARNMALPELVLDHAVVFLEKAPDGRKSWLLDLAQKDEQARIGWGRVVLNQGTLGYDDVAQKTHIRSQLSTSSAQGNARASGLTWTAQGQYRGLPLKAMGSSGPVLALRDTAQPYPLQLDATLGATQVTLHGTVTGLLNLSEVDMHMVLKGDSMEQLYPLLGIAFPATRAYSTQGHLRHFDSTWRYEDFSGRVGQSDLAGVVQVVTGGSRPMLTAVLQSQLLALDDLGPVIGARAGSLERAQVQPQARVLPDIPFHAERWSSVNADVSLKAKKVARPKALPIDDLQVQLHLQDEILILQPLKFGFAGGTLSAHITLNGRSQPIQAQARLQVSKLRLSRLFPTMEISKTSLGEMNGEFDLTGRGNSVGAMLASSNGTLGLVVSGGQISRLMMEKAGLHVWEVVALTLTGDKPVKLRCVVADFDVKQGTMQTNALVLDTQVTTLYGSGSIDLAQERLNLTLQPRTKITSPVALSSPIYVRGSLGKPRVTVDVGKVALRAAGAVALGLLNPLLALVPLVDAGPGKDSDCGRLVRNAQAPQTAR